MKQKLNEEGLKNYSQACGETGLKKMVVNQGFCEDTHKYTPLLLPRYLDKEKHTYSQ